jgi:hypothetical protein
VVEGEPNAILTGGPEPVGGREVHVENDQSAYYAITADRTRHVWWRAPLLEPMMDGRELRVYIHLGRGRIRPWFGRSRHARNPE